MEIGVEADCSVGASSGILGGGDAGGVDRVDRYDRSSFSVYCKCLPSLHNRSLGTNNTPLFA